MTAQSPVGASAFLPPDHWAYSVLRRLDNAGQLPAGSDLARRSIPQGEVAALLSYAAANDSAGSAAGYLRKFNEEFRLTPDGSIRLSTSVLASYDVLENQVLAGRGYDTVWTPGVALEDEADAQALGRASLSTTYFGAAVATRNDDLLEAQGVLASGTIGFWGGRRELGFRVAHSGGMITNAARLDGAGLFLARPLSLPVLNHFRFETHVSKVDNVLNFQELESDFEPWFWTARGSFEPLPRLRVGITRGMMFGGERNLPVTASRLLKNLIGIYTSDDENSFANQNLSVDFLYRIPSATLPVALYFEWGTEDAAGGWWAVPGIVGGIEIILPRDPDIAVGIERVEFTRQAESNSIWYQNSWFRGSWADAGRPIGHPMGGHGTEWRVFATGGSASHGISADVAAFTRRRRSQNILAPARQGSSVGGVLNADARLGNRLRLVLAGEVERGSDPNSWTASTARAGLRLTF